MKTFFNTIFSMWIILLLMLVYLSVMAVATFVESHYNVLLGSNIGVRIVFNSIYGSVWFGFLMLYIVVGLIYQIIKRKLYRKNKLTIFIFHIAIIVIFIGGTLTRYMGEEGIMSIRNGTSKDEFRSHDTFVVVDALANGGKNSGIKFDKKLSPSSLNSDKFDIKFKMDGKNVEIKYLKYLQYFKRVLVKDKSSGAKVQLMITQNDSIKETIIEDGDVAIGAYSTFSLNKKYNEKDKNSINIYLKNNNFYFKSSKKLKIYSTALYKVIKIVPANKEIKLQKGLVYMDGKTSFVVKDKKLNAHVNFVKNHLKDFKTNPLNYSAVITKVTYGNKSKTVALKSFSKYKIGIKEYVYFDDLTLIMQWGSKMIKLPFALKLINFKLTRYAGSNTPSSYMSNVLVLDKLKNREFKYSIYMNHVLDYGGYRFFQSSYDKDEKGTILSVSKDPGKIVTYIGYFLLFLGLILFPFSKNSKFFKLLKEKNSINGFKIVIAVLLFTLSSQNLKAYSHNISKAEILKKVKSIDRSHAKKFGKLLILDYRGRLKPLDTVAIEILNKVSKKQSLYGLSPEQVILGMMTLPTLWQRLDMIKVESNKIKKELKQSNKSKLLPYTSMFDPNKKVEFILYDKVNDASATPPNERNKYQKDLLKVSERVNIAFSVYTGDFFKIFPIKDSNNWLNPQDAMYGKKTGISSEQRDQIVTLMQSYFDSVYYALNSGNWDKANKILDTILNYQKKYGKNMISSSKVNIEILSNKLKVFSTLEIIYFIAGFILIINLFLKLFNVYDNDYVTKMAFVVAIFAFLYHTFGLIIRYYIANHAPWSDTYEGLIFISWTILLAGIIFAKHSYLTLSVTFLTSAIVLFVSHLSFIDPQITPLQPVLKSYWLVIHVSVITLSYGFLTLCALLSLLALLFYSLIGIKNGSYDKNLIISIKESYRVSYLSMTIGLILLIIGNFLGGIWANESWGRYWGWDPKETWTLITIVVYTIILHLDHLEKVKFLKIDFKSNYTFFIFSLIAFSSILMTYFGVNYYLSGLHSYAKEEATAIPKEIYLIMLIMIIIVILSFRNIKRVEG